MTIDTSKLRLSTKSFLAGLFALGTILQIPQVAAIVSHHPHIEAVAGVLITIIALLHNPQIEAALGIKTTTAVTQITEAVNIAPDAK